MRYLKAVLIAAVILLACIVPVAAAQPGSQVQFEILTDEQFQDLGRAAPITGNVRQGETMSHAYTPGNERTLEFSLKWNQASGNDLDLCIYPPNSEVIRLHDEVDGRTDGDISVKLTLTPDTARQKWAIDVVGSRVSGAQSYTLIINSY